MPAQIQVTDILRRGNRLHVRFDGVDDVEGTRRDLREYCRSILNDDAAKEVLKAIAIARGLRLTADSDDADDLDLLIGKTLTFNHRAPLNLCRIT
jgi:hypothetical protein